ISAGSFIVSRAACSRQASRLRLRARRETINETRHVAAACTCSISSGDASRVPRHLGYLLQPRKKPLRPLRTFIGAPHSGHVSLTATCGTAFLAGAGMSVLSFSLSSSGTGLVPRHLGKALQPRNGPRKLLRTTMGAPHFSHATPVSTGVT